MRRIMGSESAEHALDVRRGPPRDREAALEHATGAMPDQRARLIIRNDRQALAAQYHIEGVDEVRGGVHQGTVEIEDDGGHAAAAPADFVLTESNDHLSSPRSLSPRRRGAGTQYAAARPGLLGRPVKPGDAT